MLTENPVDSFPKYKVALHAALVAHEYEVEVEPIKTDPVAIGVGGVGTVVLIANSHHGGFKAEQELEAADYIGMPRMLAKIIGGAERQAPGHERDVRDEVIGALGFREKHRLPYAQRLARATTKEAEAAA